MGGGSLWQFVCWGWWVLTVKYLLFVRHFSTLFYLLLAYCWFARCLPSRISNSAGFAIVNAPSVGRWPALGCIIDVGYGIGVSSRGEKVSLITLSVSFQQGTDQLIYQCRSHAFYYIFAAFYVAELVGSFTAAATTDISPWISCGLSMLAIFACLLLLRVTPDSEKSNRSSPSVDSTLSANEGTALLAAEPRSQNHPVKGLRTALLQRKMLLALPIFLTGSLRFTILNVLIQYASNRFGLKISTGALFYTETAIVNILLFLLIVPALSSYIQTKYEVHPRAIDLFMSRTCVFLLALGSLLMGLSPSSEILPVGKIESTLYQLYKPGLTL
jgi:hypothetical protein